MRICSIEGCIRPHSGKNLCKWHYDNLPENKEKAKQRAQKPHIIQQRKDARAKPERKKYMRNWQLKKDFNISIIDFNKMFIAQHGRCAICEKVLSESGSRSKTAHVDHNHSTGKVRGLLCKPCNQGIGFLRDNIEILANAIEYLKEDGV